MTDYAYSCDVHGAKYPLVDVVKKICTVCKWEQEHPGQEYPYK